MASLEMKIRLERKGLMIRIYSGLSGRLLSTVNLQEHYGLSDDNAQWLLKKLDEKEKEKAD